MSASAACRPAVRPLSYESRGHAAPSREPRNCLGTRRNIMRYGLTRRLARAAIGLTLILAFTAAPVGCTQSHWTPCSTKCKSGCKCKKGGCKKKCDCPEGKCKCKKAKAKCPPGCTKPCCQKKVPAEGK